MSASFYVCTVIRAVRVIKNIPPFFVVYIYIREMRIKDSKARETNQYLASEK